MINSSIKSSGGTYTTIALWEAGIANSDNETGEIQESYAAQTTGVVCDAANTGSWTYLCTVDSSNQITQPTYSQAGSKARITMDSEVLGIMITVSRSGFIFEKMGFKITNCVFGNPVQDTGSFNFTLRRVMMAGDNNEGLIHDQGGTWTIDNCGFAFGTNGQNFYTQDGSSTTNMYQCSWNSYQGPFNGIARNGGTLNCYGVIIQRGSIGDKDFNGTIGGDYNVSKDASSPGSNSLDNQTGVYTNGSATTENLSLTSSTTYAIVNRSGFPSDTDTDIAGTSRPSTGADAGCWQNAVAAGVIKTWDSLAWASVKVLNGLANASIKKVNGAAAQ